MKKYENMLPSNLEAEPEATKIAIPPDSSEYQMLKTKESFGFLKQRDFNRLLTLDIQRYLKDNPPIIDTFSPEDELKRISKLSKEEKKEVLEVFKEKLSRQREAIATMRVFIERSIKFNHDVPRKKLMELINLFTQQYGLDDQQKQVSEQLVDEYYKYRQRALEIREQFSDDYELIKRLARGVNLDKNGALHISVGPMTIDIEVDGLNAARIYEKKDDVVAPFPHFGFASQSPGSDPIFYIVVNKDKHTNASQIGLTKQHEHEHQKNKLLQTAFQSFKKKEVSDDALSEEYNLCNYLLNEENSNKEKAMLKDFFIEMRSDALERAKDEITAALRHRSLSVLQKQLTQLFFTKKETYDYLKYLRDWEELKDDSFYQETTERILVQEYREIIQKAVDAYAELINKGKYSTEAAIALLTDKSLQDWPKTIQRLLE